MSAGTQFDWSKFGAKPVPRLRGQLEPGNIDLSAQPIVKNPGGGTSTVYSMSFMEDGREVLVPRVTTDGRILSEEQAIAEYRKTGRHLGKFDSPQSATEYARALHGEYESRKYARKSFDWSKFGAKPVMTSPQFDTDLAKAKAAKARALQEKPPGSIQRFLTPAAEFLKSSAGTVRRNVAPQEGEANLLNRIAGPGPGIAQDVVTGMVRAQREAGQDWLQQTEPLKQVRGFLEAGIPLVGPLHRSLRKKVEQGDVAGALGEGALALVGARGGKAVATGEAGAVAKALTKPPVEFLRTSVPSRLINSIIRTPKKGYRFGRNPGLAVAQEGIVGTSEESLLAGIKARAAEIETARNAMLAKAKSAPIDIHKTIRNALGPEIDHAKNIGNRAGAEALRNLAKDLQKQHPRFMSPTEATALKSELGRGTNWTSDSTQMLLNDGRRRLYNRLRFQVELKVPKVGALNERWGNLLEAEKALEGAIALGERRNFVGLGDIVAGGAGAVAAGASGFEPIVAGTAAMATRRLLGSTPVKTVTARTLARRLPKP